MADMAMYGVPATAVSELSEDTNNDFYAGMNNTNSRPRFPGLYVGNLTWWTTDQDVINAINSVGVDDVQEVKFFENRNNGQSKGFCVVTFTSENSLPIVMEKLPKLELYGQNPVVTPYNRQNLNLFESQTKTRPQINSNNGPNSHAAGIMGISSISGIHANTQGFPLSGLNTYNQGSGIVPRGPSYHTNMRLQMRTPRPMMRGSMANPMNNGPMLGHQMNRMRFMQPQAWNNSQGAYNSTNRMPQVGLDVSSRLGVGVKQDETGVGQDMISGVGASSYYTPHHQTSQSDHYRGGGDVRDHRDLRDDRDRERESNRRLDDRPLRPDERSLRHDERSLRHDERSHSKDDRSSSRREDRSSRREEVSSRREEASSSRRDEVSSRRDEISSRRDEGSSRRDERSSRREEKPLRREKSHRSGDSGRSRSRERSRDRSRDKKDRRDRRERY